MKFISNSVWLALRRISSQLSLHQIILFINMYLVLMMNQETKLKQKFQIKNLAKENTQIVYSYI